MRKCIHISLLTLIGCKFLSLKTVVDFINFTLLNQNMLMKLLYYFSFLWRRGLLLALGYFKFY